MWSRHVLLVTAALLSVSALPQAPSGPTAPQPPSPRPTTPDTSPTTPVSRPPTTPQPPSPSSPPTVTAPGPSETVSATDGGGTGSSLSTTGASSTGTAPPAGTGTGTNTNNPAIATTSGSAGPPPPIAAPFQITASTTQAIAPIPTSSIAQNSNKSTINTNDHQIQYQGDWAPSKSSCDPSVSAMKCTQPNSTLSYQFKALQNAEIYLSSSRSPLAGLFVVSLDTAQFKFDGFSPTPDTSCSITWSQKGLTAGLHNLTILYDGPSPQASGSGSGSGSFELDNFQFIGQDTSSTGNSSSSSNSGSLRVERRSKDIFLVGMLGILLACGF